MYFLQLNCRPEDVDPLSGELWEAGTEGVRELDNGDGSVTLLAAFRNNLARAELLEQFASFSPSWIHEEDTDWVEATQSAWPGRSVGERIFLATPWCAAPTPGGRERLIQNPGLACGTGEHPCTQLALRALEQEVRPGCCVIDVGTGSGLLSIAALKLGARLALGLDIDEAALQSAKDNFDLNQQRPDLVVGSTNCIRAGCADIVVANINASVLLALADELLNVPRHDGVLILTGFQELELDRLRQIFARSEILDQDGWSCVISKISWPS